MRKLLFENERSKNGQTRPATFNGLSPTDPRTNSGAASLQVLHSKSEFVDELTGSQLDDDSVYAPRGESSATSLHLHRKLICARFDKTVHRELRRLAFEEESTVQALIAEAVNMLFSDRGLPKIAKS